MFLPVCLWCNQFPLYNRSTPITINEILQKINSWDTEGKKLWPKSWKFIPGKSLEEVLVGGKTLARKFYSQI